MRGTRSVVSIVALVCLAGPAAAQQEAAPQYVLGAYYRCNINRQARADSLYERYNAPVLRRMVQDGKLSGFGYSAHRHGGAWRRLEYYVGTDMAALFRAQEELGDAVPAEAAEFTQICGSHDDYMWEQTAAGPGTGGAPTTPVFSMSTYYECDAENEARADEIVTRVFAPIMNRHAAAGHLTSWTWLSHMIGGPFRRTLVLRAPDLESLVAVTGMVNTDARATPEFAQFSAICGRHTDYIWAPIIAN